MRLLIAFSLTIATLLGGQAAMGQARPAAIRESSAMVGASYDSFAPDYGSGRIQGFAVFGSFNVRSLGIEGILRRTDLSKPSGVGEATYLVGPKYQHNFGRLTPYVKVMGGIGTFELQLAGATTPSKNHYFVYAFGGGLDVSLSPHYVLRAIDYEAQMWPKFGRSGLSPNGFSSGVAYRF